MLYIGTYRPSRWIKIGFFTTPKPLLPVTVQGYDIERHRGDVHGESLGIGQQEAKRASQLPLALQGVDQGEGQAQGVDQQVGWGRTQEVSHMIKRFKNDLKRLHENLVSVCVSTTEGGENKHTSSLVSSISSSTESFPLITSQSAISSYFFLLLPVWWLR